MNIHVGDVGSTIQLTITDNGVAANLSGLSVQLVFTKPSGAQLIVIPVFTTNGSDGNVQYITQSGDINEAGFWQYQAIVQTGSYMWNSDIGSLRISPNVDPNVSWKVEMLRTLRHMINDIGVPTTYSDDRLQELILVAAQLMQGEISFSQNYKTNIAALSLTPDPTLTTTRDDSFINLSLMKAACIIDNSEARAAALKAVYVRDAGSSLDLKGPAQAKLQIWQRGWCTNYSDARYEYIAGNIGAAGAAVLSPFRLYGVNTYGYAGGLYDYPIDGRYR